jgi:UDP-N-acetylglucosamine 2-epimerase (non-hydrolysing)
LSRTVCSVVGARPNFMKIALLHRELRRRGLEHRLVHTGQHYDDHMSRVFFEQLRLPRPDHNLGVGSGTHAEVTGKTMMAFERICLRERPDLVVVVGDVNSTLAAALAARKLDIPVAHVEAGLRSFDEGMPEEHNRRLTDCLSNLLFATEPSAMRNLEREGMDMRRAHLVGDAMLETLLASLDRLEDRAPWQDYGLEKKEYVLCTMHRPQNVDAPDALEELFGLLQQMPWPVLFPMHPRTRASVERAGLGERLQTLTGVRCVAPVSYLDFLCLMRECRMLFSDSGSVQSEAALFNVPCLSCRENTERPVYTEQGTTELVGRDADKVRCAVEAVRQGRFKTSTPVIRTLGQDVSARIAGQVHDFLC